MLPAIIVGADCCYCFVLRSTFRIDHLFILIFWLRLSLEPF
jgi:hypothetical protein